jgi:cyclophilin family peptidyl-prolyl cis-trans isomerase
MMDKAKVVRAMVLSAALGAALSAASIAAGQNAASIDPQRRYVAPGQPVPVWVHCPADALDPRVLLLDERGTVLDGPASAPSGPLDLGAALPAIWNLRQAAYAQLMTGGRATGSALVVQPMLTRLPPRTERALRPDGKTIYTRIVGWGKIIEPPSEPMEIAPAPVEGESNLERIERIEREADRRRAAAAARGEQQIEPQFFSGVHLFVDEDVLLHTDYGDIRLAMRPDEAPNTVWSFRTLVDDGFYDGLTFHRIVPFRAEGTRFVIQGGDPRGDGEGGPGWWLPNEPSNLKHDFGTIGMARDDHPDSAGSQFFIALSREGTRHLDGQYCAFGYAVDGAKAIRAIADVELADTAKGRPAKPPVIVRAELVAAPPRTPGVGRPDAKVEDEISAPSASPPPRSESPARSGQIPR